ncbi:Clp protease N-terminal domain-containing protein [Mycobacteroides abscessus]|uniref:Clp protease N-terminal domain-containing protein n=1 Tax=Mycobacteroides abscessus TaxID=36809 RepID=UPI000925D8AF|nr:Clp protease N-terminal domain-containing protein [Mycobacteroides abscessus]SHP58178.1 putative ATP-dependent Clp protease [Mycobacteroides abscessus subsp. abscessus]SHR84327.1 putative ATP-dependent Clp protease [Mycobacteroides abscessus subsp. abscessus]SHS37936.1 putative ATP-dependent Clp protease [Mycobacteroides abscessus subsp. abscessus]SKD28856.1 putative ATP-dependent Clp protease [Mycobacteroides abscessus subsp. abscessus]SKG60281.1 putative ATP-dependent Clp protease [Mycoba
MFEKFQKSAKVAVILSQEEAREMDDTRIGAEHVLVGVLDSVGAPLSELMGGYGLTADGVRDRLRAGSEQPPMDEEDAEALRAIGIDLSQVRESVSKVFGPQAFDKAFEKSGRRKARVRGWRPFGMIPFNSSAKKCLELALREAIAHKDNWIGCEHMVLGILRGGDPVALAVITERVSADELRHAVVGLLDQAA